MNHAKQYGWAQMAAERRMRERRETAGAFLAVFLLTALGIYTFLP